MDHPSIAMSGCSPDGLVGFADGLVEIKAPNTATHIDTLLGRSVPSKYNTQIHWQLAGTGRAWCDFVFLRSAPTRVHAAFRLPPATRRGDNSRP